MEFDPNDHEHKDIIEGKRRFCLPVSKSVLTSVAVFSVLVIWLVSGVVSDNSEPVEPARALAETSAAPDRFKVTVETLSARPFADSIRLQARTEADKLVTIAAETGGTISKLPVDKGAFVQRGQTICRIDVGARQAQLDQARAMRDARKIEYNAAPPQQAGHTRKASWPPPAPRSTLRSQP